MIRSASVFAFIVLQLSAFCVAEAQPTSSELGAQSRTLNQYTIDLLRLSMDFGQRGENGVSGVAGTLADAASQHSNSLSFLEALVKIFPEVKPESQSFVAMAINPLIEREIERIDTSLEMIRLVLGDPESPAALVLEARDLRDQLRELQDQLSNLEFE